MEQIEVCDLCGKHFNMLSHVTGLDFIVLIIPNEKLQGVPFLVDRSYAFESRNLPKANKQTVFETVDVRDSNSVVTADAEFYPQPLHLGGAVNLNAPALVLWQVV